MRVLLAIPHVFAPRVGSLYSSQTESKRAVKERALQLATIGNVDRHSRKHLIHASLGKGKAVVNRELNTPTGVDITVQVYTRSDISLAGGLIGARDIEIIERGIDDPTKLPLLASKRLLEQSSQYDIVGYMEDDIVIEDTEFFRKVAYLVKEAGNQYAFMPHRCEMIPGKGDVILSGDPDGGRPDLFWDTGERIKIDWPLGCKTFYRATNPHSGCYFLTKLQALSVLHYWEGRSWKADFQLAGPMEQAASGILLPCLKIMKPVPEQYRFLMVRHQDCLWERHAFEK